MAEKEERIVCRIIEKGYACDYCFSRPAHKYYQCSISNNDCTYDVCKQCSLGMTRQEVICKIARAICRAGGNECIGDCESCDLWKVGPEKDYAEAALNVLLEGK